MGLPQISENKKASGDYKLVTTREQLAAVIEEMRQAPIIAVDTETEGLEYEAIICGVCLSAKPGTGYYIPVRHTVMDVLAENQLPADEVFESLKPMLEEVPCIGHNVKFDQQMLWKEGIWCNFTHDTLAAAVVFGDYPKNGLKHLVLSVFGHQMAELDSLFPKVGSKKPDIRPAILSPEQILDYAVEDANWTLQLFLYFQRTWAGIGTYTKPKHPVYWLEMQLLPVVGEMEAFGLPADRDFLVTQGELCTQIEKKLRNEIIMELREQLNDPEYDINFGSNKDLAELLFQDLKLPIQEYTKNGAPSVGADSLKLLAEINLTAKRILTLRTLKKLNSTYLHGLIDKIHTDGRIRCNFNQLAAATGRFSSSKPNLQNLPRTQTFFLWPAEDQTVAERFQDPERFRQTPDGMWEFYSKGKGKWVVTEAEIALDGYGKACLAEYEGKTYALEDGVFKEAWRCPTRNFVAAEPGKYLVEADFSQIELRILAGESGEPTLLDAYKAGLDVHKATAATMQGITLEDVTEYQRQAGKTINFSLMFGAGAANIAKQLGISKEEAQRLVDQYFASLQRVGSWIESSKQESRGTRMALTRLGRVRRFPLITLGDNFTRAKQERECVNFRVQGAAADVMKLALVRLSSRLRKHFGDKALIVSTVHDSAVLEVSDEVPVNELMAVLRESMTTGINKASFTEGWPDLEIDVKKGRSWGTAKDVPWDHVPDEMPDTYVGELPRVRVRNIAQERAEGLLSPPGQASGIQLDVFSALAGQGKLDTLRETSWVLEIPRPMTEATLQGLQEFLNSREISLHPGKAPAILTVYVIDEHGEVTEASPKRKFFIQTADQSQFRIKVGDCVLRQVLSDIDPEEVLKGIDFGV